MVTFLQTTNRAISTLASDITSTAASLDVASGDGALFPDEYPFHVTIDNEISSCTKRVIDTLYVTRAQQGTTAASHSEGAAVELRITAKHLDDITDELLRIGGEIVGMEDKLEELRILLKMLVLHLAKMSGESITEEDAE